MRNARGFDHPPRFGYAANMTRRYGFNVHGLCITTFLVGVLSGSGCSDTGTAPAPDAALVDVAADVASDVPTNPDVAAVDAEAAETATSDSGEDIAEPDSTPSDAAPAPTTCPELPCDPGELCEAGVCVCDPAPVSFAADIAPILEAGCGPGCHVYNNPATGSAGLNLAQAHAWKDLVDVPAFQCGDRRRVVPGDIRASYLMNKMLGRDMCSGNLMPRGRSAWTTEKLAPLGRWICQGADNN